LVYAGKFTWVDTEIMPIKELDWFYTRLVKQKRDEKAELDKLKNKR